MEVRRSRIIVLGIVMALTAACGTGGAPSSSPVASGDVPDLHGTWTGTWGGTPLTVLIREQESAGGDGGVYLGSWQIAGRQSPTVSGVMTFTRRGDTVSTGMQGWLHQSGGLKLVIEAAPSDGRQDLVLSVADGKLTGNGTSSFHWGPQGTIELTRAAP